MMQTDPLAQLRDIHLPEPVSAWPPGPGWWFAAVILLLLLAALAWWAWRRHRDNGWRRQAVAELEVAHHRWQQEGNDSDYLQQLSEILKRAAINRGPATEIAALTGDAWNRFLDAQWRRPPDPGFAAMEFSNLVYRANPQGVDIDALHTLGKRWLQEVREVACSS